MISDISKCIIVQYGFLLLMNFALVSETQSLQNENLKYLDVGNLTITTQTTELYENDDEYFERTFLPVAAFTLETFKIIGAFYDELLNQTTTIQDEEIRSLEQKIKQFEGNEKPSEQKETDDDQFENEKLKSTADGYNEHEFQQLFYNKKINEVIHLVKRNVKLVKSMQDIRNEITTEKYMSSWLANKQLSVENPKMLRALILKLVENEVPEFDYDACARRVITNLNTQLDSYRRMFNENVAEKNEKIRQLKKQIEQMPGNEADESVKINIVKDEL